MGLPSPSELTGVTCKLLLLKRPIISHFFQFRSFAGYFPEIDHIMFRQYRHALQRAEGDSPTNKKPRPDL